MVDLATYRARIGCFSISSGSVVDLETLRVVGVPCFIGMLLFMAGIELNPGPFQSDELSNALLPEDWSTSHFAAKSTGNGNCLYNSCSLALCGDDTLAPNLRHAVAQELHNNAPRYGQDHPLIKKIAQEQNMLISDIVVLFQTVLSNPDDEPLSLTLETISEFIMAEGLRTYEDKRWATILHVMGLSTVLGREVRSVYPDVPWNYRGLYNNSVHPAGGNSFTFPQGRENISTEPIVLFWTRDGDLSQTDHVFVANHVVPLIRKKCDNDATSDIEIVPIKKRKTQQKLDNYFNKSGPTTNSDAVNTLNVPTPIHISSSSTPPSLTPGICPDLATLVFRRTQLSEEEKFHILNFNVSRLSKYPTVKQRKYNISWETQFNWLRYSVSEDGTYCAPCFVFAHTNVRHTEFTCTPFKDWKNAVGNKRGILTNHNCSQMHIDAATASVMFLNVCTGNKESINASLSTAYSDKISDNRHVLMAIIEVIIKLSSRGIPLRGRWVKDENRENSNFNYFLDWISTYDEKLSKHLKSCPKNAKYTSPQFQNEIITCIGDYIRNKIVSDVSKSPFFSIMADETTDVSLTEQMSVCVRYIVDNEILEDFIGFVELPKTNAETITMKLIESLQKWNLDLSKWRGKGFDGASTMSGQISGVQARITALYPHAKYFTHCKSHCLNLVVVSSCNQVPQIRNFMNTFQQLTFFFHNSAKRKAILNRHMSAECAVSDLLADIPECEEESETVIFQCASKKQTLPTLSDTRWLSRIDSISTLLVHYEHIYDALSDIRDESRGQSASDASSYLRSMESFEFIIVACLTQYILAFIRPLSVNLQAKNSDLLRAHTEANNLVDILRTVRSKPDSFEKIYNRSVRIAAKINIIHEKPRVVGRQKHRANAGENTSVQLQDHFKINHFYPFLDHVMQHLTSRFPEQLEDVLEGTYLLPGNHEHLTNSTEEKIKQTFSHDLPMISQFETEVVRWKHYNEKVKKPVSLQEGFKACDENYFPNINAIFQLILSLPVGSCSCERSFSALRRLKTWTRSTMVDHRLNGLALMFVHKNIAINRTDILRVWDSPGHRRVALAFD